jgi:hypothetical protein
MVMFSGRDVSIHVGIHADLFGLFVVLITLDFSLVSEANLKQGRF